MKSLILVNGQNMLTQHYKPRGLIQEPVAKIWVKKETYDAFCKMNQAAQTAGLSALVLVSGYRPYVYQEKLFNKKIDNLVKEGLKLEEAIKKASTVVARPGTSEHQTGLAIDLTSDNLAGEQDPLIEVFGETEHGKWLNLYAHHYGFILRYPKDKTHITKITYEPWHYRYVGAEHAGKIKTAGICLEEYIACLDIK